jgi:rRNA maturation RNase YbeY
MTEEGFSFILPPDGEEPAAELISFQVTATSFELTEPEKIIRWIETVIEKESCQLAQLNYIFCSDEYLHRINLEYLKHDTFTDIITFPYADPPIVQGDIFISIDRIRDNAEGLKVTFQEELRRVMIHGVLHLCGYADKHPEEKTRMTHKEDEALALFH